MTKSGNTKGGLLEIEIVYIGRYLMGFGHQARDRVARLSVSGCQNFLDDLLGRFASRPRFLFHLNHSSVATMVQKHSHIV